MWQIQLFGPRTRTNPPFDHSVFVWWLLLCLIACTNLILWVRSCPFNVISNSQEENLDMDYVQLLQWILAGIFTFVCAFRSIFPRVDLERFALFQSSVFNSAFVGRLYATIAEVSFAVQCRLVLPQIQQGCNASNSVFFFSWIEFVPSLLVPLLFIAQLFCWYAIVTLNPLGHVIEETIWMLSFALVGTFLLSFHFNNPLNPNRNLSLMGKENNELWNENDDIIDSSSHRQELYDFVASWGGLACVFYVLFMCLRDIPMYMRRWKECRNMPKLSLGEGLQDAFGRVIVRRDWKTWAPEMAWMTLYFSVAVWCSQQMQYL